VTKSLLSFISGSAREIDDDPRLSLDHSFGGRLRPEERFLYLDVYHLVELVFGHFEELLPAEDHRVIDHPVDPAGLRLCLIAVLISDRFDTPQSPSATGRRFHSR